MASNKYSISVFLPFFNEEGNIRSAISQTIETLENMENISDYEVIAVDDGSHDKTREIAEEMARENAKIRIVGHKKNLGYGQAVKSGIANAHFEYVFFTDGDLQFDIGEIKKLTGYVPEYDVVIGYRHNRQDPFVRLLNAKVWNMLNGLVFGLKAKDIDCAFKLFKREAIADIALISSGAMLSAELLIRLQNAGVKIKEVPVTHLPRKKGSPTGAKLSVIMKALSEFWFLYRNTEFSNASTFQVIKFMAVGVANTAVDFVVYYLLTRHTEFFAFHVATTRVLSFLSGSICSFILNRIWTFGKRDRVRTKEVVRFYITVLTSLVIGVVSMQLFISVFHLYDLLALGISLLFTFIWNFCISKLWVFM